MRKLYLVPVLDACKANDDHIAVTFGFEGEVDGLIVEVTNDYVVLRDGDDKIFIPLEEIQAVGIVGAFREGGDA